MLKSKTWKNYCQCIQINRITKSNNGLYNNLQLKAEDIIQNSGVCNQRQNIMEILKSVFKNLPSPPIQC